MRQRTRKLIGTVLIAVFVPLYSLIIMTIGAAKLADSSTTMRLLFFAFFGLVWVIPAGAVIYWMQKPEKKRA